MTVQQGVGAELELRGDKARANIQDVINQLSLLERKLAQINTKGITLNGNMAESNIKQIESTISSSTAKMSANFRKTGEVGRQESAQTKKAIIADADASAKAVEQSSYRASRAISGFGRLTNGFSGWGKTLNDSVTQFTRTLVSPIKGIFSLTKNFVTNTVNDSIGQIEKLELAQVGLQNHFKSDKNFDIQDYIKRIRNTAETTQGLSAGDLADYISQLAPLTQGDSEEAFAAAMGALKIIRYGGGDTTVDMMSVIKNIRDVQAKGKAYQMDLNQFNRAAPLLATMLEQQGMGEYVKRTDSGALTLNITKENADSLVTAFARLNENKELNDVFNAMTNTLSGLMEQTKQSIANDMMDLIKYSQDGQKSLLDLWKDFLQGTGSSSLRSTIRDYLQQLVGKFANFLSNLDGQDILKSAFNALKEFGSYVKSELLPAFKELLGVDENSSPTEVIKGIIQLILQFGKGIVQGMILFINIINTAKSVIERVFGEGSGATLLMAFGWVKGFGKMGWDLVSGLGKLVEGIGNASMKLSKLATKYLGTTGVQNLGGGIMTLGIGSSIVDAMVDTRPAQEKVVTNLLSSGATLVGGIMTGHPVIGVIASAVQLVSKTLIDIWQDTNALRKKVVEENDVDLATAQAKIVDLVLEDFANQDNPIYRYGDATSERAAAKFREWAKTNIKNEGTEEEMLQQTAKAAEEYKKIYTNLIGGNKLLELANTYMGKKENGGYTRLTETNANNASNSQALKKYWDYLVKYNFVQQFANWDKVVTEGDEAGANILAFITGNKIWQQDPTVEGLQNLVNNLGEVDAAVQKITDQNPKVEIQVLMESDQVTEAANRIKQALEDAGLNLEEVNGKKIWIAETTTRHHGELGDLDSLNGRKLKTLGKGQWGGLGFNANQRVQGASEEGKRTIQNSYEINSGDLLGQWAGAREHLRNGDFNDGKNQEDFNNWVNSVNDTIGKAMSIIFNGGELSKEQQNAVVTGLKDIYGNWNQVFNAFDPEQIMTLVHGIQDTIGEDTAIAVQMLRDGYDFGTIGIIGSGVDRYKEASAKREGKAWYFDDLWRDIKKKYLEVHTVYRASGGPVPTGPPPRNAKSVFFNWGGSARGVDTVPAMLRPGEFVEKTTAVNKAGLGVMNALNEGDLGRAYRLLGAKLNTVNTNSYDSRRYNTSDSHNVTTNNFRFFNNSQSAVKTSYRGLRNIMALR